MNKNTNKMIGYVKMLDKLRKLDARTRLSGIWKMMKFMSNLQP